MLDKVSTEIQGLPSTDCNFQGLSRCVRTLLKVDWECVFFVCPQISSKFLENADFFLVIEIGVVSLHPTPPPRPHPSNNVVIVKLS